MEKEEILAWIMGVLVAVFFYFGLGLCLQEPSLTFKKWENPYAAKIQEAIDELHAELGSFDYNKYMQEKYGPLQEDPPIGPIPETK